MSARRVLVLVAALALLAGCGGGSSGGGGSAAESLSSDRPWDLVWFSDSGGKGIADLWAARITKDLGVKVNVHDYAVGGLGAGEVLKWIGDGSQSLPKLKETIAGAEIVVVYGNPGDSSPTLDIGTCVDTSTEPRDPPMRSTEADFAQYRKILDSIYQIVFDLRDGKETIIRAMDMYTPTLADWRQAGIAEECTAAWETWSQSIREVADKWGVPTVSIYDTFNGADHTQDPRQTGLIGLDQTHPSEAGKAAIVDALVAAGYDPVQT